MPRAFKRRPKRGDQPLGGYAARLTRLETMVFEANAYIVRLVNAKPGGPDDFDVDFLEAAEEFRRSLTAELKSLKLKGVRNGASA